LPPSPPRFYIKKPLTISGFFIDKILTGLVCLMFFFDLIYSFIGKVETGDRRLDVFEFLAYCEGLN
ncbi:hypothetical protein QWI90_10530, partial [Acinetobacter baumannii]|nr:hypothetical protein [Acinetobacter baumannii]